VLIDRRNFAKHRPWVGFSLIATLAATAWFLAAGRGMSKWPGGGSLPGLTFGVAGGALILFEFALWGRKKVRSWRVGRVQAWMTAHIWLGLLTVPLLVLHGGFRWGGSLSTALMLIFLVVIASGVWGLVMQQILPRRMLEQVPAETIHSQIGRMVGFLVDDAHRLVAATCGPLPGEDYDGPEPSEVEQGAPISHLTVGAVQTVGDVPGKVLDRSARSSGRASALTCSKEEGPARRSPGRARRRPSSTTSARSCPQAPTRRSDRWRTSAIRGGSSTARTGSIAGSTTGSRSTCRSRSRSSS